MNAEDREALARALLGPASVFDGPTAALVTEPLIERIIPIFDAAVAEAAAKALRGVADSKVMDAVCDHLPHTTLGGRCLCGWLRDCADLAATGHDAGCALLDPYANCVCERATAYPTDTGDPHA